MAANSQPQRCWYPEGGVIQDGKKIYMRTHMDTCCGAGRFVIKSDNTIWVVSPDASKQMCVTVDSMPVELDQQLEGKELKLRPGMSMSIFLLVPGPMKGVYNPFCLLSV